MITLSTFFLGLMMLLSSCNSVNPELYIDGTDYLYWFLQPGYLLGGGHRPQTIYGKLVDQHGAPVPDMEVMFSYQYGSCFAFTNKTAILNNCCNLQTTILVSLHPLSIPATANAVPVSWSVPSVG